MYHLSEPSNSVLDSFCKNIYDMDKLRQNIEDYYDGRETIPCKVKQHKAIINFTLKVSKKSVTGKFLAYLLRSNNLKKLLVGNLEHLLKIYKLIEKWRKKAKISKDVFYKAPTYNRIRSLYDNFAEGDTIDLTLPILHEIFVDNGYENKNIFSKSKIVKLLELRVCPYCGRSYIYSIENNYRLKGSHIVKPQIDHFFPKSKYPYFALSYFNLIPICHFCNMIGAKGDNDALGRRDHLRYPYPYRFKDSDIKFYYEMNSTDYFNPDSFSVHINYSNGTLEDGCRKDLSLDDFYASHNWEVFNLFRQFRLLKSKAAAYYGKMNIPSGRISISPQMVFGFDFNELSSRNELLYKVKKDIFEQISKIK